MPRRIAITTPEQVELEYELAGLGSRLMAFALDALILAGVLLGLYLLALILGLGQSASQRGLTNWVLALLVVLIFVVQWGYFVYFELTQNGRTPGKRRLGLRVIRDGGQPIDVRGTVIRNIVRLADLLFGLGLIVMFVSQRWQRLGDYAAGSLVVKDHPHRSSSPTPWPHRRQRIEQYEILTDEALRHVSQLTREDYQAITYFLRRTSSVGSVTADRKTQAMAETIRARIGLTSRDVAGQSRRFLEEVADAYERVHSLR